MENKPKIRIAQAVIGFKDKAMLAWNLEEWEGWQDKNQYVLFFGLYRENDYGAFIRHKGKKIVFWCGTDILNLMGNYDSRRVLKLFPETEHWCENTLEAENLNECGVKVTGIVPSFLDNINNFPVSYKHSKNPHIFLCGHPNREDEYGADVIRRIASRVPDTTFHFYGIDKTDSYFYKERIPLGEMIKVDPEISNIWYHGKVPEGQFNNEIINYQCGLRTNEHDGFSEVTSKSILMGQYPITKIIYPNIWSYQTDDELVALIEKLKYMTMPNTQGRSYYIKVLNQFPFNQNKWKKL